MYHQSTRPCFVLLALFSSIFLMGCGGGGFSPPSTQVTTTSFILVTNSVDNTVSIFNAATMQVVSTVALSGTDPAELVLSADQRTAYVINRGSNGISVIDIATGLETSVIPLSTTLPSKSVLAQNGFLYVTHEAANVVTKVNVAAAVPIEDSTIMISADSGGAIVESNDGASLYVGSMTDTEFCKIDIATGVETSAVQMVSIADMKIHTNGMAFIAPKSGFEIIRYDTTTDMLAPSNVVLSDDELDMEELVIVDGKVFVALNAEDSSTSGGVVEFSVDFDSTNYQVDSDDDDSFTVNLPFPFMFQGQTYNDIEMNSNGSVGLGAGNYIEYDEELVDTLGFEINSEDLDSGDILHYSTRTFPDHVVCQWQSSCNDEEADVNYIFTAEITLYSNGTARYDYLQSGPSAIMEDDGYEYGVGDGTVAGLVDLRPTLGSPFSLTKTSLLWDPTNPNTMTMTNFAWEGTGIHFHPAVRMPDAGKVGGVSVDGNFIFMSITEDFEGVTQSEVLIYDRTTMLPTATPIGVGMGAGALIKATLQN